MSKQPDPPQPGISTGVVIILILVIGLLSLTFLDIEPFYSFRASIRKGVQNLPSTIQQVFKPLATPIQTSTPPATATSAAETQTIGNWAYTLNSVAWDGKTVTVGITVQNTGDKTYPFGFGYQVSDESFNSIYKLCAVDANRLVFWDTSIDKSGTGFYNRSFAAGEKQSGTLTFTVSPESQRVYLTIANGGNPANKLFYLGNPQ